MKPNTAKLGPSWGKLGQVGAKLRPSWVQVGAKLGQVGPTWSQVGAKLGPSGGQVEPRSIQVERSWCQVEPRWGQDEPRSRILSHSDIVVTNNGCILSQLALILTPSRLQKPLKIMYFQCFLTVFDMFTILRQSAPHGPNMMPR